MNQNKIISLVIAFFMLFSLLPNNLANVWAEEDTNMSDMNALSALGIDTSVAPEGFDENDTSNPYGKDTVTINPVNELYVVGLKENTSILPSLIEFGDKYYNDVKANNDSELNLEIENQVLKGTLYGHNNYTSQTISGIMDSNEDTTIAEGNTVASGKYDESCGFTIFDCTYYLQTDDYSTKTTLEDPSNNNEEFNFAASKVVSGNFDGNTEGKTSQTVLLYAGELKENGGLYMRIGDALNGDYGSEKTLIDTNGSIGNPSEKITNVKENFATDPYLIQNYLQVTTGDYDGDGIDEIAVFVPEYGNSRIVVYKLKTTTGQTDYAYRDADQWEVGWTYSLQEEGYVSNMVSLVSGDFNEDGVTDLAATWGYYYGPDYNNGSKAVIMFGSKGSMLQESQEFDLTYGDSQIVRASFTFGDLTGSGSEVLILGGQSDKDLKNGKISSRYVALYSWNGEKFVPNIAKNFDLFEKDEDGNYINGVMAGSGDKFYSSSLCPANIAVVSQGLSESAYLYLDSLLIRYGENGLEIAARKDRRRGEDGNDEYYVEYGIVSGDLVGLGYDTVITMMQTMSSLEDVTLSSTQKDWYYKNWWDKIIDKKTWYYIKTTDSCNMFVPGKTYMIVTDVKDNYEKKTEVDSSTSICLQNTDHDTSYMQYTGTHYFKYTDPEILAVLASPPYFSDLINRDDLSGNYAASNTSYSSTKGTGGGETFNSTIESGIYVSMEQDINVFGFTVASAEAEMAITAGFTYETEKMSSLEQTVSYTAALGEDMVAFFSIPLEIYEYTAYISNGDGTYTEQKMTVNIPRTAAVQLLSLDYYENIAKDYDALPQISGNILTHKLGDPSTYSSSLDGYLNAIKYNGDWARVGYSSNESGASTTQEISMSEENSESYSISAKLETKVGAGAGGITAGVTFGSEIGKGWVTTSTSGNSFSGEIQNMPIEAEEYGYSYSWKIFSYLYDDGKVSFPIVNYLVTDVAAPAPLPTDFEQNFEETTDTDIVLTWTYDKQVAGFQIYRYYEFPDGFGSYELAFIPMTDGVYSEADGLYHFKFIDKNLSPYTVYKYQIQTVRSSVPNNSIPSEFITARTKTEAGYPQISLSGLDQDGLLRIYPDSISTVSVNVENHEDYPAGIAYQWQKLIDGVWEDMAGKTSNELTFTSSGVSDEASYRCRTNVIYYDSSQGNNYYISAYSDPFETKYSKRTPLIVEDSFTATTYNNDSNGTGVNVYLELVSGNTNHYTAPQGNVTFTVTGTDYTAEYTVELEPSSTANEDEKFTSTANLDIDDLPDGVYEISAYYSGNRVFKSLTTESITFLIGESGYQLILQNGSIPSVEYTYGDKITPTLKYLTNSYGKTNIETITDDVTYELNDNTITIDEDGKYNTSNIGKYTLKAKLSGKGIVAQREYFVSQREITVQAVQEKIVGKGNVKNNPPKLEITSGTMAFDEELIDLNLTVKATNSAGNPVTLDNSTEPGNYTIIGSPSSSTDTEKYNNYKITYIPGIYTIIGQTYSVEIEAEEYQGRQAGTITLANSDDGLGAEFSAGTELLFYAIPYDGYEVDSWNVVVTKTGETVDLDECMFNDSKTRLAYTMKAEGIKVTVTFKKSKATLTTAMEGEGTVNCDNPAFVDGGYVNSGAEMTFTATPAEGYTFKYWKIESGGVTVVREGTQNEDESNTITYTMGSSNTILRAIFERESYTITLADNLEAVYEYKVGDLEGSYAEKTVYTGAKIVGDTEVLVRPRAGYEVAENAVWKANGEIVVPDDDGYRFNITEDTIILVDTIQLEFDITTIGENGTISVTINDIETDDLTNIPGGSKVVFTAHPAHGYVFEGFQVTGTEKYTQDGAVLTIDELGSDVTVEGIFTESTDYTVKVNYDSRGSASYVLYDAFGVKVKEDTISTGGIIEVCDGDDLILVITPDSGYMVDKWIIDDIVYDTKSKTYTFENISDNIDVQVDIISQTSYTVNYGVSGGNGSISSATTDGRSFQSGDTDVGGNSTVIITSNPDDNYMVGYWTINGETVLNEDGTTFIGKVLNIDNLTSDSVTVDIKVYFTEQVEYEVNISKTHVDIDYDYTPNDAKVEGKVRDGAKAVFTITPEDGYRIVDAKVDGSEYTIVKNKDSNTDDYGTWTVTVNEVNNDLTVTAEAKEIHSITIDEVIGGTLSSSTTTKYPTKAIEGEVVTITQEPDIDYTFGKWAVSNDETVSESVYIDVEYDESEGFSFNMPDSDVIVSAVFDRISTVDINCEVYDKNGSEDNGYDGTLSAEISRIGVNGYPKTAFQDRLSGQITSISRGYEDEYVNWPMSTVTITANPDEGYKVLKWTIDGEEYTSPLQLPNPTDSMNILVLNIEEDTEDMEVIVQFEPIGDAITYHVDGENGKIISATNELTGKEFASGNIIAYPTDIIFVAEPDEGYEVEAWLVDGDVVQEGPNNTFTYEADGVKGASITVRFARIPYTVIYGGENGTVTSEQVKSGEKVRGDTSVTFTAYANPGYKFDSYTVEGSTDYIQDGESITVVITEDTIVTAHFVTDENCIVNYSVEGSNGTLEAEKDGEVFESGSEGAANDIIIFTAKPDANYIVKCWTVDGEVIETSNTTFELTVSKASHNVTVEFERSYYEVTFNVVGENGTITAKSTEDISSGDILAKDSTVIFTAVPGEGYQVKGWKVNDEEVVNSREKLTYEINKLREDTVVTVEFEEIPEYNILINITGTGAGTVKAYVNGIETPIINNMLTVKNHDVVKCIATPKDEYNTVVWSTDGLIDCEINNISILLNDVTSDATLTATFKVAELITVKADSSANGTISAKAGYEDDLRTINAVESAVNVTKGKTVEFTAHPDAGYMVKEWKVNGEVVDELGNKLSMVPESNINVEVAFETISAHKIIGSGDGYTISDIIKTPDTLPSEYEDYIRDRGTVTFTITPESGYYFDELNICSLDCINNTSSSEGTTENIVSVNYNNDYSYTITIANVVNDITASISVTKPVITIEESEYGKITAAYKTYEIINSGDSVSVGTEIIVEAEPIDGYKFSRWGDFAYNKTKNPITIVASYKDINISAIFRKISTGGGSGGGGSSEPEEENPVIKAIEEGKKNKDGKTVASVEVNEQNNKGEYELEIPEEFFEYEDTILEVQTPEATVSLPNDMFDKSQKGDVQISINKVDPVNLDLPEDLKDKPIIEVNLEIDGKRTKWASEDKEITISIPYRLTEQEKLEPHKVVAVYIDDDGNITPILSSDYDFSKGAVVFKTKHTSYYSVQYVDKNFEDIGMYTWAKESIEALAARGIIKGVSDTKFAPQDNIARADFVLLVTRFFGFNNSGVVNFEDVEPNAYYYDAVATAKYKGIIKGTGNNKFNPKEPITREDMMVIIERALKIANMKDELTDESYKSIGNFVDKQEVSVYAVNSVDYLIRKGIVSGDGVNINPKSNTKRAEVAVLLYNLLGKL